MYPIVRMIKEMLIQSTKPKMDMEDVYESTHICWPWDLDVFMELNNGRTLTLYDLGRLPFGLRTDLYRVLKDNKWFMTMAGATVTYRKRVRAFHKFTMKSGVIGRDSRFIYLQQSMWRKGVPLSSIVYRVAYTDKNGIVPTEKVAAAMGRPDWNPEMPKWVNDWIAAEADRPWPPSF